MKCQFRRSVILKKMLHQTQHKGYIVGCKMLRPTNGSVAGNAADSSLVEPKVGMMFNAEDEAYAFYNSYAKRKGFSVRKGHISRRRDGTIKLRHFLCSNEGTRKQHCTHTTKKPRAIQRTNCLARIEYKVSRDSIWVVHKIIEEHNHPLTSANKSHLLRSHRKKLAIKHGVIDQMDNMGDEMDNVGVKCAIDYDFLQREAHAHGTEDARFPLENPNSILLTMRTRDLEKGDAQFLLDFLKAKQLEDPSFFYAVQLDEKERLTNFFWADARSIIDYTYFGDAVTFDTTYRMNMYELPFASFIGINHHKQIVVLGAALLLDETAESFRWLFKTFTTAMSGRQPKTILTDYCPAITEAITMTLPETCHRFCLWHLLQNASELLSHVYNTEPDFPKEFKDCIYECGSEEDFRKGWDSLITKYDLSNNSWLEGLYANRDKWAVVYHRNSFYASMATIEWGENMDNHIKMYLYRKLPPPIFMIHFHKALIRLREKELVEDRKSRGSRPVLLVDVPMLNIAAESYTKVVYKDFEAEYRSQLACLCEPVGMDGTLYTFRVSLPQKRSHGLVEFNSSDVTVTCSCKKFDSMGILCMHALKVLNNNNILHLPSRYILKRWTKYAKDAVTSDRHRSMAVSNGREPLTLKYSSVLRRAIAVAVQSACSEDALLLVERRMDSFILEMENALHSAPLNKITDNVNIADKRNILEENDICFDGYA